MPSLDSWILVNGVLEKNLFKIKYGKLNKKFLAEKSSEESGVIMIDRYNPDSMVSPFSPYSQGLEVPAGTRTIYVADQVEGENFIRVNDN